MMQHSGRKPFAALLAASCLCAPIQAAVTQWRVEDGGNGHYYDIIVTPPQYWEDMRVQAAALGGYLASIRSAEENNWIWNTFNIFGTDAYWVNYYGGPLFGGFRLSTESPWTWVSGEPWDYSNFGWHSNDGPVAVQFIAHTAYWDDVPLPPNSPGPSVSMIVEWNYNPIPAPSVAPLLALAGLTARGRRRRWSALATSRRAVGACCQSSPESPKDGTMNFFAATAALAVVAHASGGANISFLCQWTSEQGGNDHWYGVIGTASQTGLGLDWNDALQQARSLGGDLVSLTSSAENEFVYANIASDVSLWHSTTGGSYCYAWGPWIGLRAVNNSWAWSDGSPYSFSAWAAAEPYEGTVGWVQYYRAYQNWGPPIPDSLWDNTGSDRGMYAIVEWTFNPVPAPAAAPLLALAGLLGNRRRRS